MDDSRTVEERLTNIERALAEIQSRLRAQPRRWIERLTGSMKNLPEFEQALEFGRQFRHADRPEGESP